LKSDLLLRIKDAETAAGQRVAQAEAEAKQVVAESRRQAEALLAEGRAQADFAYTARIEQARKAAETEGQKAVAKGKAQAQSARKGFESGLSGATGRALKVIEGRL
jgi:vacuolar-type H+-ATPase subunit H